MSDTVDMWRDMHDAEKADRQRRRSQHMAVFIRAGIPHSMSNSTHVIVQPLLGPEYDYWPSTGKFHERGRRNAPYQEGGVRALLRVLGWSHEDITKLFEARDAVPNPIRPSKPAHAAPAADALRIPYQPHMSAFAIQTYRDAGFVVDNVPEDIQ